MFIATEDLVELIEEHLLGHHMYADDTQLIAHLTINEIPDNIKLVNLDRDLGVYLFISMKYNLSHHHCYGDDVVNSSIIVITSIIFAVFVVIVFIVVSL